MKQMFCWHGVTIWFKSGVIDDVVNTKLCGTVIGAGVVVEAMVVVAILIPDWF